MIVEVEPIGFVRADRKEPVDDAWGGSQATIELEPRFGDDALAGIESFSHAEILFHFHLADPAGIVAGARHPRNRREWPAVGIFAQRGKGRPNRLGTTLCRILGRDGRSLRVAELDAVDGTPVIDIKPVMQEFLPRTPVTQPDWSHALMRDYWKPGDGR